MRLAPLALLLLAPAVAPAQTVSAEGSETVRLKPDTAKVSLFVVARHGNQAEAADRAADAAKSLLDDLTRLKLKGVKLEIDPLVAKKLDGVPRNGAIEEVWVVRRAVLATMTDPDPKVLLDAVDKVQKEAADAGSKEPPAVYFSRTDSADDGSAAALTKATKKAAARAEAIAAGLGMKLGGVAAAEEVPPTSDTVVDGEIVRTVKVRVVFAVVK